MTHTKAAKLSTINNMDFHNKTVGVLGLGYVGLPLAVRLAQKGQNVIGFDIKKERICNLKNGYDDTQEIEADQLNQPTLTYASSPQELISADIFIITVPTPIDQQNLPDLTALQEASRMVGELLQGTTGKIVIFESTVYPGVTENICGKIIEESSGLESDPTAPNNFYLAYAPERMNPGDKEHHLHSITKVVAAQTPEIAKLIEGLYGQLNNGNVFIAKNIQTAEAAKVIENAQRDINIAFINEVTIIFQKLGLNIYDVLDAAKTKWNFLPFEPGLVGGHCIGVDPYYLAQCAKNIGHHPDVILAGRRMNNHMSSFIGREVQTILKKQSKEKAKLLILGLTFKENVPDMRNSKVQDLIHFLKEQGHEVDALDPYACPQQSQRSMGVHLFKDFNELDTTYDGIILAVAHDVFKNMNLEDIRKHIKDKGYLFDIKGVFRNSTTRHKNAFYWCL